MIPHWLTGMLPEKALTALSQPRILLEVMLHSGLRGWKVMIWMILRIARTGTNVHLLDSNTSDILRPQKMTTMCTISNHEDR
jgi:hypothetical protein